MALEYVKKCGVHKMRLLTFEKNRGKGGAVRMVSLIVTAARFCFLFGFYKLLTKGTVILGNLSCNLPCNFV